MIYVSSEVKSAEELVKFIPLECDCNPCLTTRKYLIDVLGKHRFNQLLNSRRPKKRK